MGEEKLMTALNYPWLASHREVHQGFVAKMLSVQAAFIEGQVVMDVSLLAFVYEWLKSHVMNSDRHIGTFQRELHPEWTAHEHEEYANLQALS
eukprot:NODE_3175_length_417_cov_608.285326_g2656_i0.p1 GENE.NODE_3175_length_417_cov_608.285326_g2656_i0~~NODE_3175_length_417_cov_608.285326_g2656_i0.p1  ORF type:complete len:103 (-),score=26.68 NODE_3175_length_417_cov_608.285326_g2656_i0:108-386(-)